MQHRFYGLRGDTYVKARKVIFEEIKKELAEDFHRIVKQENGKFTPRNFGELAMRYRIPLSILQDYLFELGLVPCSSLWDHLKDRGCQAKDIGVRWHTDKTNI